MKVLSLSAYAAHSHEQWQRALEAALPDWEWVRLTLEPRHFSWRMRGNPLYWSLCEKEALEQPCDLLLATSMVDLATLRGLVPALARVPSALYFHENQFAYPQDKQKHSLLDAQMVSLYSALAADRIVFNSEYNRHSFLTGLQGLLDRLPDRVPEGVCGLLHSKSLILPVPVDIEAFASEAGPASWPGSEGALPARPVRILWQGRFEHDKGADLLAAILADLEGRKFSYELALVGQRFRTVPEAFERIEGAYEHRLVHTGFLPERTEYEALLRSADLVLSTALHEFQGLAVLEAVAAGAIPVVPDRLAYRDQYASAYRYPSHPQSPAQEARGAGQLIEQLAVELRAGPVTAPDLSAFHPRRLGPAYRAFFEVLAATSQ